MQTLHYIIPGLNEASARVIMAADPRLIVLYSDVRHCQPAGTVFTLLLTAGTSTHTQHVY